MQEKQFRNQVTWMLFILSILVIWVHSYNAELFAGSQWGPAWDRVDKIEDFFSVGLGQIAVPGFFFMSSYLFFRNFKMKKLISKWKSRFFSVVVPYIVWTSLYYLGYVTATRFPGLAHVVGREPVPFNIEEMVLAVLEYSYAPIFWYLYQLIILIFLSPLIYAAVKDKVVGILYLLLLLAAIHFHIDSSHPNTDALFYYSAAAYTAVHCRLWMENSKIQNGISAVLFLAAAVFCYILMQSKTADVLWTIGYRLSAPLFLWKLLSLRTLPDAKPWMRQSMFLYAVHFIPVRFVNKAAAMLLHGAASEAVRGIAAVLIYLLLPAIVTAVSYSIAGFLVRHVPAFWRILSGGRKLEG